MNNFFPSSKLLSKLLEYKDSKKDLNCDVLFPDGTVIKNAKVSLQHGGQFILIIWVHGIEFNDYVGGRLASLKFKITEAN